MKHQVDRRSFAKTLAIGTASLGLAPVQAAPARKLKIGHTCITWGAFPRANAAAVIEASLNDISSEGFWSYETFPELLGELDAKGALAPMMEKYGVPLQSGYISVNVIDQAQRKSERDRVSTLSKIVRKYKGSFVVLSTNGVRRDASYDFKQHRDAIVAGLNDYASAVTDLGLGTGLHQHTGTPVETRDEVYAVMETVNTDRLKFAPDVGQLQKGGADAAKVVKDFASIVKHMHLKDYKGWEHYAGYCPLGMGQVDLVSVLDTVESSGRNPDVMIELDPSPNAPMTPLETIRTTKAWLQKQGYTFRT
jgi:inosose dehydratase